MSETPTTPEPEVSTPTTPEVNADALMIDRTELERLRATDERMNALSQNIGDFESLEDYQAELERLALDDYIPPATTPSPPAGTPATPAAAPATPDQSLLRAVAEQQIRGDYVEFKMAEADKPAEERCGYSKELLTTTVWKQSALVGKVAQQRGGNLIEAARAVLDLDKANTAKMVAKAKAEGASTEAAKSAAAQSATIPTGGEASLPKTDTPEDKALQAKKAMLDRMLPDDPAQAFE